ncbi:MAG TPA: hypothetical protein VF703_00185 [Pyrinomonadaceae bacterium]|jgi:hypothetical protein
MGNLMRSTLRKIGATDTRAFSAFEDYLKVLVHQGVVGSVEELVAQRPDLLGSILFEWYRQGQIACVFAQRLARDTDTAKWQSITIRGTVDAAQLEGILEEAADKLEALQLIFPGPGTAQQAVELIKSLCAHISWSCHEIAWMPEEHGDSLQVGLRWHRPDSSYVSWVLGIAPFEPMPFTRRFIGSPFIALVFRPSPPSQFAPTPVESGLDASHLAHMDDGLGSDQGKRENTTNATRRAKHALLGEELRSTARAKVTFALPGYCRDSLSDILIPV